MKRGCILNTSPGLKIQIHCMACDLDQLTFRDSVSSHVKWKYNAFLTEFLLGLLLLCYKLLSV